MKVGERILECDNLTIEQDALPTDSRSGLSGFVTLNFNWSFGLGVVRVD